jgi:hypothetical protein
MTLVLLIGLSACTIHFTPKPIPPAFPGGSPLPVSGFELPYTPGLWNDYSDPICPAYDPAYLQCTANCYAYALNFTHVGPHSDKLQPGELSGHTFTAYDVSVDRIVELVRLDAQAAGFTFVEGERDVACASGSYKVALFIDPFAPDYHWLRQNPDGTWSGKSGLSRVTDKDASGQTIVDPQSANLNFRDWDLNYTEFGGYYCIGSPF